MLKKSLSFFFLNLFCLGFQVDSVYSQPDQKCNWALNSVAEQIYQSGASVSIIQAHDANNDHVGNPSHRQTRVMIILGKLIYPMEDVVISKEYDSSSNEVVESILNSVQLQQEWANYLVKNCRDLAVVAFGQAYTDWINEYAINTNGLAKARECIDSNSEFNNSLPWGYQFCL
ncbi:hypothetical protein Sta7437_0990 [Stanieria cyanosphaera PCC 7437]|uniref:Uncharacterized protein n=1 Tax=Stanieria cyanosphaera (strain ATCC 29371 / PCC 7437) TaxID=111780 RepID=K9XPP1_STAC7|nr:hypothetical protein [Stanieria cyanosphaera]AFZ34570.1 hypothetical protein Sta7437_0990 [Stanieria cyanosphaera PCC 7437]